MTALEFKLRKGTTQKSICIKHTNGKVDRVKEGIAYNLIKNGQAEYCSKTEWKQSKNSSKPIVKVEKEEFKEESKKDRIKGAKNIRKANKKK